MKRYPKVLSLGQPLIADIFSHPVEISEKIDGSQCRIHLTDDLVQCGSKNVTPADEKMFRIAHQQAERIWNERIWRTHGSDVTLFAEFLNKEKHNVLAYDRVPLNNLYLFGAISDDKHLQTSELIELAADLQIESPNIFASQKIVESQVDIEEFLELQSVLGDIKVEGVVIKQYNETYPALLASTQAFFGYPMAGKLVRDDFKERLNKEWSGKKQRETPLAKVATEFFTDARFHKAIQHLEDEGKITYEMSDLKDIIPEFYNDLVDEEHDEIVKLAMMDFWRQLKRKSDNFAVQEWKKYLIEQQFDTRSNTPSIESGRCDKT